MLTRVTLIWIFSILLTSLSAQVPEAINLGNWQNDAIPNGGFGRYNEVWGITQNGQEYGIIGSRIGTHFIQLDHPDGPTEVAYVAGADDNMIHRDYHNYQHYLYAVADEGSSTLQVIDYSNLPESVEVVYDSDDLITRSHNIFIDETNARLYTAEGRIYSLENPEEPIYLGNVGAGGHDIYVRDNIAYTNRGNNGLEVNDCTDPTEPEFLGELTDYSNSGYNHSGWLSQDGKTYILCDETGGTQVKSINIEDPSEMEVLDLFKADNENPGHIPHNVMIKGNFAFVSYYSDGLWVFDFSDPTNVTPVYHYDTYPGINNNGFLGAWGVYTYLPSDRILVSDLASGLYVLKAPADHSIHVDPSLDIHCMDEEKFIKPLLIGNDFDPGSFEISVVVDPPVAEANIIPSPLFEDEMVLEISNFQGTGKAAIRLVATDAENTSTTQANIKITTGANDIQLTAPLNNAEMVSTISNLFSWDDGSENPANEILLEFSTTADFTEVEFTAPPSTNNLAINIGSLESNTQYYWRVKGTNNCGASYSEIFTFTTELIDATSEIGKNTLNIYPNPTSTNCHISSSANLGKLDFQLTDQMGRVIKSGVQMRLPLELNTADLSNGIYFFNTKQDGGLRTVQKIIVAR